ncbi:serine/threonine-protein kinase 35-like isoform X2 [Amphiura filiformis]|uniref:serine/threonine-protein kinase 35-like isoform X2 n=1 Tax=Amphiura filiformis TaxID=82378 RepID=UPI003B2162FD
MNNYKMPSMMHHFTPLDKIRCGYFGVEHKVKEKKPRGKFRVAKLVLCAGQTEARYILNEYKKTVLSLAKHQNILTIKDAFLHKQKGSVYLCSVSKFMESSETLNSFILARHASLCDEAHKALFLQLVDAVSHLHSHGIAHNALTPFSVRIVESKGNALVKLTDFGLAQICGKPDHENYDLDISRARSLAYYLPPESQDAECCKAFGQPNTAADIFMLGLLFNAIAEHSILPQIPNQEEEESQQILASYLEFPGYGAVPIGKFMNGNPSVDLDYQLFRRLSSPLRRLIRRMVFLEPDGRPPITGVLQMLEPIDSLIRHLRRNAPERVWSQASLDS